MSDKTKKIDLQDMDKLKLTRRRRRVTEAVDTGSLHDVDSPSMHEEKDADRADVDVFSEEFKNKYRNPFKRLYRIINEEELSEKYSERVVRLVGIFSGLFLLFVIFVLMLLYYFTYSSYTANCRKGQTAEDAGNTDAAIVYYEKALEKTNSRDRKISVLNNLVRLSEGNESTFNLKSYLTELAMVDTSNTEPVNRLKELLLADNDLDAIFSLAKELENCKNVEALYDILQNQPQFNYKSGTYDEPLMVSIRSEEGASVYYTLDGSEANETAALYAEPFLINEEGKTTVHAISINAAGIKSKDYSVTYNIVSGDIAAPVVYPKSGTYTEETEIVIEVPTGCTAYYTLDESEPDINAAIYKPGMTIAYGNHIFTVKFIDQNGNESESTSRAYIYEPSYDVSLREAIYSVQQVLIDHGKLRERGEKVFNSAGDEPFFDCANIISLDEELFYCITMSDSVNGESNYAVNVKNGAVFALQKNPSGSSYLTAIE